MKGSLKHEGVRAVRCLGCGGITRQPETRDCASHTFPRLLWQVVSTLALETPALAADDEEAEEEGDDSQIIDLDGINGKKLAVLLRSLAHSCARFSPPLLSVSRPLSRQCPHSAACMHATATCATRHGPIWTTRYGRRHGPCDRSPPASSRCT